MMNRAGIEELLTRSRALYDDALRALQWRMPRITANMAFYRGSQWGEPTLWGYQIDSDEETRATLNYVRGMVRAHVATLLRTVPTIRVASALEGPRARYRAQMTDRYIRSLMRNGTLPIDTFIDGETDIAIKGGGFYKMFWNPRGGKMSHQPVYEATEDGGWEEAFEASGTPKVQPRFEGAHDLEYVDIIDALVDPHANREAEIRYIFHRKVLPVGLLEAAYPKDAFGQKTKGRFVTVERDAAQTERDMVQGANMEIVSPSGTALHPSNQGVTLVECWYRPSEEFPQGALLVHVGDVVLGVTDRLPYAWPWIYRIGVNRVPRSLYADGVIADLRRMQTTVNKVYTRLEEIMDLAAVPKILNPEGSGLRADSIDDQVGQILTYNNTKGPPSWMPSPNLPPGLFNLGGEIVTRMRDVSGSSDYTQQLPSGLETGRALSYFSEMKQAIHEPEVASFQHAFGRIVRQAVAITRDFIPEGRLVTMLGESDAMAARRFKRDDFDFDAELVVESDQGPMSRAVRQANALQELQAGALTDDPAAQRYRKLAGADFVDQDPFDHQQIHRLRALREAGSFAMDPWGAQPEMQPEDNHEIHLDAHKDAAISEEFLALPPAAREVWRKHIEEHELQWVEQQQSENAMALPGKGGSPEKAPQAPSPQDGGLSDMAGAGAVSVERPTIPAPG